MGAVPLAGGQAAGDGIQVVGPALLLALDVDHHQRHATPLIDTGTPATQKEGEDRRQGFSHIVPTTQDNSQ